MFAITRLCYIAVLFNILHFYYWGEEYIVSNFYAEDIVGFFKLYRGSAVVKQKTDVGFCHLTLEILRKTLQHSKI